MAGEWIKIEGGTADKPEVLKMSRILGIDRDSVFGKLTRLWIWFDVNSVDGVVDGVVDTDIDRICYCDGFADACCKVGWLKCDNENEQVALPNFDRHNGETAKRRALKNKRQAKWRENLVQNVDVPVDANKSTTASTREEKRREEKNKGAKAPVLAFFSKRITERIPLPENLDHPEFKAAWDRYERYISESGIRRLTAMSVEQKWADLAKWGMPKVLDSIDRSISEGWRKLIHPDELGSNQGSKDRNGQEDRRGASYGL